MTAERFSIGGFQAALLGAGAFEAGVAVLFPSAPKDELAAVLARFGCDVDPLTFEVHPLFVDTGSNRVLIDPGTTGDPERLTAALSEIDIDPASIDTVVITHGHADHYTGCLRADGSAAFPHARHVMQRAEWDHWMTDPNPEPQHAANFRVLLAPLRELFDLMDGEGEIVPGIEAVATPGHSPGHASIVIGGCGVHCGDVLLHPISVERPDWPARFDVWPEEVVASRRRLLERIVSDDLLVVTPHFPWPGRGRVRVTDGELRWSDGD